MVSSRLCYNMNRQVSIDLPLPDDDSHVDALPRSTHQSNRSGASTDNQQHNDENSNKKRSYSSNSGRRVRQHHNKDNESFDDISSDNDSNDKTDPTDNDRNLPRPNVEDNMQRETTFHAHYKAQLPHLLSSFINRKGAHAEHQCSTPSCHSKALFRCASCLGCRWLCETCKDQHYQISQFHKIGK